MQREVTVDTVFCPDLYLVSGPKSKILSPNQSNFVHTVQFLGSRFCNWVGIIILYYIFVFTLLHYIFVYLYSICHCAFVLFWIAILLYYIIIITCVIMLSHNIIIICCMLLCYSTILLEYVSISVWIIYLH